MNKARKTAVFFFISLSVVVMIASIIIFSDILGDAKLDEDKLPNGNAGIVLLDGNDNVMRYTGYVKIDQISPTIINAFIAVEDKRFYQHNGIDLQRIVGAMIQNVKSGWFSQGGSTISNQLIKNTQLSGEKTIERDSISVNKDRQKSLWNLKESFPKKKYWRCILT